MERLDVSGTGTRRCRALRGATPPPALHALVARAAHGRPAGGGVAVHQVRRHQVGSRVQHHAAPARAGRGQHRRERRARPVVDRVVPARLPTGAPALARRAPRPGRDAGRRVPVVARADHAAVRCRVRVQRRALYRRRLDCRACSVQRLPARLVTTPQTAHSFTRRSCADWLARSIRSWCYACAAGR